MKTAKIILMFLVLFILGCKLEMSKSLCEGAGGKWNECGSSCAGTDAEFCIQVCVEQCECNEEYKCPKDFKCRITEKDEFGVCIKE